MKFVRKNKILSLLVLFAGGAMALSSSLYGINGNEQKFLQAAHAMRSIGVRRGVIQPLMMAQPPVIDGSSYEVHNMLKTIEKEVFTPVGTMTTPERSAEVTALQEQLNQCAEMLEQYDLLLGHLGAIFGKQSFQLQEVVDEIYRLLREKEALEKERDEARVFLGELADFAQDQTE